jgi:acetoin utilization deacetylase AcuC-like enzyme
LVAAGGLVDAVEAVLNGRMDNAFAMVRPPGHHALTSRGMGFCLFNNVAVAARYALEEKGLERILIVDFDVHHGNGTQDSFYEESSVLYFSTHQYPYYPGTGHWREIGKGEGQGYTANVPLPGGVGDEGFQLIFDELLYPLAERYQPQLILVSAGYDSHWDDPLAMMGLTITGYANLARTLKAMADDFCGGKIAFTLEGGYHLEVLSHSILNALKVLLGDEDIVDPLGPSPRPERSIDDLLVQLKGLHRLV